MLKEGLDLKRETIKVDVPPTTKKAKGFIWNKEKEDVQSDKYLTWLQKNIQLLKDLQFYDGKSKNLLFTISKVFPFDIKGSIDVCITETASIEADNVLGGLWLGIELKKKITESHIPQVTAQLLIANCHANQPIIMVLTDLKSDWRFYWMEPGMRIFNCILDLCRAINAIESVLSKSKTVVVTTTPTSSTTPTSTVSTIFANRCLFDETFTTVVQVDASEKMKPSGLERMLKRQKVNIMDLIPESDVANMRDVFDVMSPQEIRDWEAQQILEAIKESSIMQPLLRAENYRHMYA